MELHIPAALLTELAARPDACGAGGEWAAVIAALAAQYATDRAQDTQRARGAPGQNPAARFAEAVLRRYVQIRDRVCVHPGCRCPARHADLDHTVDHTDGGPPSRPILARCAGTTTGSKTLGGRLGQPEPGHFV